MSDRARADLASVTIHYRPRRKAPRALRPAVSLNLTPMIDVTFLLFIFFTVSTTFKRAEGVLASRVPQLSGQVSAPPALPISPIVIRLSPLPGQPADCHILVEGFSLEPAGFDELTTVLRQIQSNPGFDADTPIVILASDHVLWDHVVSGWNAAVRAACRNIAFGA
jgi:biopolymer transport protein ExbD